jgi:hypothetical protein
MPVVFQEIEHDFSVMSWFLQMALAGLGPTVALGIVESKWLRFQDTPLEQVIEYLFLALAAAGTAWILSALLNESACEGSQVWTLPLALEVLAITLSILWNGFASVCYCFYVPGPDKGGAEASWCGMFLTFPAWSCCRYSVTMWGVSGSGAEREAEGSR